MWLVCIQVHVETIRFRNGLLGWFVPVASLTFALKRVHHGSKEIPLYLGSLGMFETLSPTGATPTPPTTTQTTSTPTPTPDPGSGSGDEVEIGFDQLRYSVDEGDNLYLCVSVQSGYLTDDVSIHFSSDYSGYISATGKEVAGGYLL